MAMALVDDGSSSGLRSLEIQSRYKTNSFYIASKLHLYSNLKHLTIIAFEDEIGSHIEALCFPPAELTPSGSQLPLLTTLAIKGLPSLHRVFKVVVDARYGPSRKKLLESDLCKELKTLKVYTSTGTDETLIKSIKSFLAMREVVLELIVVGDRT
ncbi:hypothetical protein FRC02_004389 [Tulasnella sp. 418]|nr:hypothetical protein FRC02_004389 [Tulasnella sp. 418]